MAGSTIRQGAWALPVGRPAHTFPHPRTPDWTGLALAACDWFGPAIRSAAPGPPSSRTRQQRAPV
eukprot:scaffold9150_cov120-Isochrysis_galbana.AAC.14